MEFGVRFLISQISRIFILVAWTFLRCDAADTFALLSGTLRTFQSHACDGDELRLECTANTVININLVQYGRVGHAERLCVYKNSGSFVYLNASNAADCISQNALKVIEEKCRGQRLCRLLVSPETFHEDPCPRLRKYAEVAYKCRPENFSNKVVCEGMRLRLSCPLDQRLVIYSATFGTTISGVIECPESGASTAGEDCQASYATETVMSLCSGQQKCSIAADVQTFGETCGSGKVKHLKVTHTCVSTLVLKPLPSHQRVTEEGTVYTTSYPGWVVTRSRTSPTNPDWRRSDVSSTVPSNSFKMQMQSDEVPTANVSDRHSGDQKLVSFMSEWVSAQRYLTSNKDRLILYVTVSLGVGLLLFATLLGVRLFVSRYVNSRRRDVKSEPRALEEEDPFFGDTEVKTCGAPVANYAASLKRLKNSDAQPRAPVATGNELDHYFC